jgi:hypothetical protein
MNPSQALQYYFLEYTDDIYLKGEANEELTKFGVHLIKDVPDSMFQVNCPFEMRIYRNDLVKCIIDFENFIVSVKSLKREGKNIRPEFDLVWNIHPNKQKREDVFFKNKKILFDFFDQLKYEDYLEIKRQLRYAIKKLIYLKFYEIDNFFDEMIKYEKLGEIINNLVKEFSKLKNEKLQLFNTCKNNFFTTVEKIDNLNLQCNNEINLISENLFKSLENYLDFFIEMLNNEYFTEKYSKYNDSEYFMYSETSSDKCLNSSYLFEKSSYRILKIKNNKFKIFYDHNQNLLELEYNSDVEDEKNCKNKGDPNLFENKIKILEISYKNDKNLNLTKFSLILNDNYAIIKNKSTPSEPQLDMLYIGEYKDDSKNGFGFEIHQNINRKLNYYLGNYKNDKFEGYGILGSENYFYLGEFIHGMKNGKCEVLFKNDKEVYQGNIDKNILKGDGKYYFNKDLDQLSYQGEFNNNLAEGKGKIEFSNGDNFIGQFKQQGKIGEGKYSTRNNQTVDVIHDSKGEIFEQESKYKY